MQTIVANGAGNVVPHRGGVVTCVAYFDAGSGTIKYQFCPAELDNSDDSNWIDTGISFTASGMQNATLPAGSLRPSVSGAAGLTLRSLILGALGRSAPERWA